MNQYFTPKMINSYMTSFSKCNNLMVKQLLDHGFKADQEVDLLPHLEKCALQAVCTTLFGMDVADTQIDELCARTAEIFNL